MALLFEFIWPSRGWDWPCLLLRGSQGQIQPLEGQINSKSLAPLFFRSRENTMQTSKEPLSRVRESVCSAYPRLLLQRHFHFSLLICISFRAAFVIKKFHIWSSKLKINLKESLLKYSLHIYISWHTLVSPVVYSKLDEYFIFVRYLDYYMYWLVCYSGVRLKCYAST